MNAISGAFGFRPLCPQFQTYCCLAANDVPGHNRTHALQQKDPLFNHIVSAGDQVGRHVEADGFGGLDIDNDSNLVGSWTGRSAGFATPKNLVDVSGSPTIGISDTCAITDKSPIIYIFAESVARRHTEH